MIVQCIIQPIGHIETPPLKQFLKGVKIRPNSSQIWIWLCGENELRLSISIHVHDIGTVVRATYSVGACLDYGRALKQLSCLSIRACSLDSPPKLWRRVHPGLV